MGSARRSRIARALRLGALTGVLMAVGAPAAHAVSFSPAPGSPYDLGANGRELAVSDFNGDGIPDLATLSVGNRTVSVRLGSGNGAFTLASTTGVGQDAYALTVGDFDGDGNVDIATADLGETGPSVLLGHGDGTFDPPPARPDGPDSFESDIVAADFNDDGLSDLAVYRFSSGNVSVLLSNGDGTFTQASTTPTGAFQFDIATGDFDGDGNVDVVTTDPGGDFVDVLLGNGDGTLVAAVAVPAGSSPTAVTVNDLDGDGDADIAVGNDQPGAVTVLLGNGDGTFAPAGTAAVKERSNAIAAADFDGDGVLDLVTGGGDEDFASVLLGRGDGTFAPAEPVPAGGPQARVVAADFDRSGLPDLALVTGGGSGSSSALSVLLNGGPLILGAGNTAGTPANAFEISAFSTSGKLAYTGTTRTFNGKVTCARAVGNAATIVAVDKTTGRANRTMVQDNGATGDKLLNTQFDPSKLSKKAAAKALACVNPDVAKLNAAKPLGGDAIQIRHP